MLIAELVITVALAFNNGQGIVIVERTTAEKEYSMLLATNPANFTEMQKLRFAALTVALGTARQDVECPATPRHHQLRWHRPPVQKEIVCQ